MHREPMTPEGHQRLKDELHRLKTKDRPAIIKEIAAARAHGDLKENGEYHAAREKQGLLEARIHDLENTLAAAQVIEHKETPDKVVFGSWVKLLDLNTDQEKRYGIVGKFEADLKVGKITFNSPIARALIGKKKGEIVTAQVPKGLVEYEILDIELISS